MAGWLVLKYRTTVQDNVRECQCDNYSAVCQENNYNAVVPR